MSYGAPPPPNPYGGGGAYGGQPVAGTNKKAVWSLVTGIVGLLCCAPLGVVAVILGNSAKKEVAQTGQGGSGLATAGLIIGAIALVFLVIQIILIATGNFYFDFNTDTN